jgi:hypothetical protein
MVAFAYMPTIPLEENEMSRSYRHSPFIGHTTATSEKQDKVAAHRRLRRMTTTHLFDDVLPHIREISNVWSFAKDGKGRMQKTSAWYAKLMRK